MKRIILSSTLTSSSSFHPYPCPSCVFLQGIYPPFETNATSFRCTWPQWFYPAFLTLFMPHLPQPRRPFAGRGRAPLLLPGIFLGRSRFVSQLLLFAGLWFGACRQVCLLLILLVCRAGLIHLRPPFFSCWWIQWSSPKPPAGTWARTGTSPRSCRPRK